MKQKFSLLFTLFYTILFLPTSSLFAQNTAIDSTFKRCFIGSSLFMLSNLDTKQKNPPQFYQLNLGYRITEKDVVSIEFKTWKYAWSLGIPFGDSFEASGEKFPGSIRTFGIALVYQRFLWKGLYTAVHAMNGSQTYLDINNKKIQKGYQLFMSYRLGYHVPLFKKRFFIEPSVAITHRPIDTNMPANFKTLDEKWPKTFFPEPGLHFGYRF